MSQSRFMMATKAEHKLGDISRGAPDLCVIQGETENAYIGNWVTGFGFIDVRFPKETTRPLTDEEKERFGKMYIQVGSQPPRRLNIQ